MAHMYECQELVTACVNSLKKSISDTRLSWSSKSSPSASFLAIAAEIFDVARLIDSKPLKEAIFARMLEEEEDPMRPLGGVELSNQEYREMIEAWHKKYQEDC